MRSIQFLCVLTSISSGLIATAAQAQTTDPAVAARDSRFVDDRPAPVSPETLDAAKKAEAAAAELHERLRQAADDERRLRIEAEEKVKALQDALKAAQEAARAKEAQAEELAGQEAAEAERERLAAEQAAKEKARAEAEELARQEAAEAERER